MSNHRWNQIGADGKYHVCTRTGCDVKRFKVPVLGKIFTIGWASPQMDKPACPTSIDSVITARAKASR